MAGSVTAGVGRPGILGEMDAIPGRAGAGGGGAGGSAAPPSYSVHGGPTSIHANLDDLERGSLLLAAATDEAAALGLRAGGWGSLMALAAAHTSVAQVLSARTAELSSGLLSISGEAGVLYAGVRSSATAYREAEAAAQWAFVELFKYHAFAVAVPLAIANQPIPQPITDLAIHAAPDVMAGLLGIVSPTLASGFLIASDVTGRQARDPGATGPMSGPERLYPLITAVGRATGLVQIGPVRARERVPPAGDWDETWTPGDDGPMTRLMDQVDRARNAEPGSIEITRITPDGPGTPDEVWLVAIPGTQPGDHRDASGWSTNPFDVGGNGEAMALDSQHVTQAIDEALRDAGAAPGDALVLTGYSQGGIHATRAAADPRINGHFDVQGLFTVGSPTGDIETRDTVDVLHLHHKQDFPAGLDGTTNPPGANRTTITVSGYNEELYPEGKDLFSGHLFENYRYHAEQLETDPEAVAVAPVIEHLGALTTGGGVTRTVQLERQRPGQPRNPLGFTVSPQGGSSSRFGTVKTPAPRPR